MQINNIEQNQSFSMEYKYEYDNYITYSIYGKNGDFSGKSTFCISGNELHKFKINLFNLELNESVKIQDNDSDGYIMVTKIDDLGHFQIFLQIGGSYEDNYVKIKINTDNIGIENFNELLN